MNHKTHIKWFRITAILSSAVFCTWLICLGFLIDQTFDLNTTLEFALVSVWDVLFTLLSTYFDTLLYVKSDKDIDTILRYVAIWKKVCKFKIIAAISIISAYVIVLMAYSDHLRANYLQRHIGILILSTLVFAQTTLHTKIKFVYEDCIANCDHGVDANVIDSPGALNENQVNVCDNLGK